MRFSSTARRVIPLCALPLLLSCQSKDDDARPAADAPQPSPATASARQDYRTRYVGNYRGGYWPLAVLENAPTDTFYVCGNSYVFTVFRVGFRPTDTIILGSPRRVLPAVTVLDSAGQFTLKAYVDSVTHRVYSHAVTPVLSDNGRFVGPDSLLLNWSFPINSIPATPRQYVNCFGAGRR